jgi:iron complex transport system substrate-binding protein
MFAPFRLFFLALLTIALAACGSVPVAPSPTTVPIQPTATPEIVTITDDLGRTITLNTVPQRIVSMAPSVTEMLFAIGAENRVVGVTAYCNYPAEADALPEIGGFSASSISVEAIVGLQPDLVIAGSANQQSVVEQLEELELPVVVLAPDSFDAVYGSIRTVGTLTGNNSEAEQVVSSMRRRVAAVTDVVATIPAAERPTVYWEVFNDPLMTSGPQTFIGQMIELVGATNIFADASEDYPTISSEAVIERDPEVIIGPASQEQPLTVAALSERPGWSVIEAIREERVYTLDGDMLSRPGPRLADAIEALAQTLYPEAFK